MCTRHYDRREFLAGMGLSAAALLGSGTLCAADPQAEEEPHVAINQWSVGAMRGRDNKQSGISLDEELAGLAACGINGLEPGLQTPEQAEVLAAQLAKHGLEMRSVYTGSELLDPTTSQQEIERIVALAQRAKALGTKIIVTNPSPLPERRGKTDAQLEAQAAGLNQLGRELTALGLTLAYHNHDVELAHAAPRIPSHDARHRASLPVPLPRRTLGLPRRRPFAGGLVRRGEALRPAGCRIALAPVEGQRLERGFRRRGHRLSGLAEGACRTSRCATPGLGAGSRARDAPDNRDRRGPSRELPLRARSIRQRILMLSLVLLHKSWMTTGGSAMITVRRGRPSSHILVSVATLAVFIVIHCSCRDAFSSARDGSGTSR